MGRPGDPRTDISRGDVTVYHMHDMHVRRLEKRRMEWNEMGKLETIFGDTFFVSRPASGLKRNVQLLRTTQVSKGPFVVGRNLVICSATTP